MPLSASLDTTEDEYDRTVHHLSRALSLEWAPTQMLPAGRWNQPEDLVGAVLFLCSHLSDMAVGHVLMVDGAWTLY